MTFHQHLQKKVDRANAEHCEDRWLLNLVNTLWDRYSEVFGRLDDGWVGPAHIMESHGVTTVAMSFRTSSVPKEGTILFLPKGPNHGDKPEKIRLDSCGSGISVSAGINACHAATEVRDRAQTSGTRCPKCDSELTENQITIYGQVDSKCLDCGAKWVDP